MKAVILAGGYGTRLSEETMNQPKPMVTIGDRPIIWHIMKIFLNTTESLISLFAADTKVMYSKVLRKLLSPQL